jgi:hypothetical protein
MPIDSSYPSRTHRVPTHHVTNLAVLSRERFAVPASPAAGRRRPARAVVPATESALVRTLQRVVMVPDVQRWARSV